VPWKAWRTSKAAPAISTSRNRASQVRSRFPSAPASGEPEPRGRAAEGEQQQVQHRQSADLLALPQRIVEQQIEPDQPRRGEAGEEGGDDRWADPPPRRQRAGREKQLVQHGASAKPRAAKSSKLVNANSCLYST
jgi:hypothetical protein